MTDLPARCPKCGTHVVVVVGKRAWCVLPYTEGGCGWTGTASAVYGAWPQIGGGGVSPGQPGSLRRSSGAAMIVRPCGISVARVGVARLHRHLRPPPGAIVAFEAVVDGWPIGWALVGRATARVLDQAGWVEVTRCATDGTRNACSALYGAAARWARAKGLRILTYTRTDEPGSSLRGAGWVETGRTETRPSGRPWARPGRVRRAASAEQIGKIRWSPPWVGGAA